MNNMIRSITLALVVTTLISVTFAGPAVVPNPKAPTITVRNNKQVVVREFKDPQEIQLIQRMFLKAKKIGDTHTHLKTATHKIDFADRWLIDLDKGQIGLLSKEKTPVYQLHIDDLKALKKLIKIKGK